MKIEFETINLTDTLIIFGLVSSLGYSLYVGANDIAMNIASGLVGYVGGASKLKNEVK